MIVALLRQTMYKRMNKKKEVSIMKKTFGIVFLLLLIIGFTACGTNTKHDLKLEGRTTTIQYDYVNFRKSPSLSSGNVICSISYGGKVRLTGNCVDHLLDETEASSWVEVEYNGQTGWVVRPSINWSKLH